MKYKLHFLYFDMSAVDVKADKYHIQSDMMILEKKKVYEGKILRTDDKYTVFHGINLRDVKNFSVEEMEED